MRMITIRMYAEGSSQRGISRTLKVSPQTITNWIKAHRNNIPAAQQPPKTEMTGLDMPDLFTERTKKKSIS